MANVVEYTPPNYPESWSGNESLSINVSDFLNLDSSSSLDDIKKAALNTLKQVVVDDDNLKNFVNLVTHFSYSLGTPRDWRLYCNATVLEILYFQADPDHISIHFNSDLLNELSSLGIKLTYKYWAYATSIGYYPCMIKGVPYRLEFHPERIGDSDVLKADGMVVDDRSSFSHEFGGIKAFILPTSKWTPTSYEFTQKELRTKADTEYYIVKGFSGQLSYSDDPDNYQSDDFEPSSVFLLHDPWINDKAVLSSMVINWESNASGSFEFTIPLTNPSVDTIKYGSYIQITALDHEPVNNPLVTNEDIGDLVWFGRVINVEVDKFKNTKVVAEGPACFVKDYNLGVFCTNQQSVGFDASTTLEEAFKTLLTASTPIGQLTQISRGVYNTDYHRPPFLYMSPEDFELYNTRSPYLQPDYPINRLTDIFAANDYGIIFLNKAGEYTMYDFLIELMQYQGFNTEPGTDENKYGYRAITVTPWCDTNEADIPADRPIVTRIFTRLTDTSHSYFTSKQKIIFAENLSDAKIEADYENMGTSICFLGAEVELDGFGDYKARYGFSNLGSGGQPVEENGEGTIIGSYINSTGGYIREYGLVPKTVIIDSLTSSRAVADYALAHRDDYANPIYKFSISAADLGKVYKGEETIVLEDLVEVHFPAMPYDDYDEYICTKIKEDLLNPSQSTYEFERATTNMNGRSYRSIRTLSKELDSAKKTISRLEQEVNKLKKGEE